MLTIYYNQVTFDQMTIYLAATDIGLCFVGSPNQSLDQIQQFIKQPYQLIESSKKLMPYQTALRDYFKTGVLEKLPLDFLEATPFQKKVWQALLDIPVGTTVSYSQLAINCGYPKAFRTVASAVSRNPLLFVIPCHRVILKNHKIGHYRAGTALKQHLLTLEKLN